MGADLFRDECRPEWEAHCKVVLKIDDSAREARQAIIEARPDQVAGVERHMGGKAVPDDMTRPLTKAAGEAFHEP